MYTLYFSADVAYRFHDLHPPGEDATIPYDNEEATLEETLEGHADTLEETRTDNLEETRTDNLEETRTDTLEETEEHLAEDPGMYDCVTWITNCTQ